jgi:hypothetical protein
MNKGRRNHGRSAKDRFRKRGFRRRFETPYGAWLKEHEWREGENEPVGLILCTSNTRQHVELLLRHGPHKMQVSEYMTKLPSKKVLEG